MSELDWLWISYKPIKAMEEGDIYSLRWRLLRQFVSFLEEEGCVIRIELGFEGKVFKAEDVGDAEDVGPSRERQS